MIKAVIFDMDGDLIDTEPLGDLYYFGLFKQKGIDVTIGEFEILRGVNHETFWSYFEERYNYPHPTNKEKQRIREGFISFLRTKNPKPFPGLKKLLYDLTKENINLALGSSASRYRTGAQLKILKLEKYFKTIVCGEEVTKGKPDPEIYLRAAEKLKVDPKNCIAIEDAKNGVESAKKAGLKVIGFKPKGNNQDLTEADLVVKSFKDVTMEILLGL